MYQKDMKQTKKNSTFECIKFKKKEIVPFRTKGDCVRIHGFYIDDFSTIK